MQFFHYYERFEFCLGVKVSIALRAHDYAVMSRTCQTNLYDLLCNWNKSSVL